MSNGMNAPQVRIEPWGDADLALLRLLNAPEMTEHLGGPETEEQILVRHKRYLKIDGRGTGRMFRIVLLSYFLILKLSVVWVIGIELARKDCLRDRLGCPTKISR